VNETSRFRELHTRTYEAELLLSGALVFGLLAAPGELNRLLDRWSPRLDGIASSAIIYLYTYGQMVVYSMLATFIAHLGLRGYWIALLGLESVWADGWNWDRLKLGPHSRAYIERKVTTLSAAINKADDRASVIFAAGALLVMSSLYALMLVVGAIAAALLLARVTGMAERTAFLIVLAAAFLPMTIIPALDRRLAGRLAPDSAAGRAFGRIARAGLVFSPMRLTAPVQFVFQSRIGERKLSLAVGIAAGIIATAMLIQLLYRNGQLRFDGWTYFDPSPAAASSDPRYYRDAGVERDGRLPTIDSDVIGGPVIRLFLPYRPRRHNPLVAAACPELAATVAQGTPPDNAAGATCVGGLYKVALDGAVVAATYRFSRDADSDFVGVLAYLPTDAIAPGMHELTIDGPGGNNPEAPREIVRIPFYRSNGTPR
jgi:hypothetical protein